MNNSYYATSPSIDYGDDPSRPPVFAEAQPVDHLDSFSETKSNYEMTNYYGGTTPTNGAVVPYGGNSVAPYNPAPESVNDMQNEAAATKMRRRRRRRVRMAAGGVTGAVVGGIALGPVGAIAGGVGGAAATRAASKFGEKRKDRRVEREKVAQHSVSGTAPIVNAVAC